MKKNLLFRAGALAALLVPAGWAAPAVFADEGGGHTYILKFGAMYGVDEFLVGGVNPVRGIEGDGLPWEVEAAKGSLDVDGHLVAHIRGLVLGDAPIVPPDLRLINPDPSFRAVVSCQTDDGTGHLTDRNLITDPVPATRSGNADFNTFVILPEPCIAPVIFIIAGDRDQWFSITGFEEE
jgi:hypothetical protein